MPPVLNPAQSKVDGLAFLGLSLARKSTEGHPESVTHQTAWDLNLVQDRAYQYLASTNDDGWLVGGGEPPATYKLTAKDSAHVEIMRIGTYEPAWGGLPAEDVVEQLRNGAIWIPQMTALPTDVVANKDLPPELEIRFDMQPPVVPSDQEHLPLPVNWQLRFVHNQLFRKFSFPSRFCPGAFHSTIVRKAEFRSPKHREEYFGEYCAKALAQWKKEGPKPLLPDGADSTSFLERVVCKDSETGQEVDDPQYQSGIYLFRDRNNITHQFVPNFLPPYDTPEKRKIILEVLQEEWDEATLAWKPLEEPKENIVEEEDTKARKVLDQINSSMGMMCGCGSTNE